MRDMDFVIMPVLAVLAAMALSVYFYGPASTGARNEIVLAMSHFETVTDGQGNVSYEPGDAQAWVVHPDEGWRAEVLVSKNSNVAHKGEIADLDQDGLNELYVAGGQSAEVRAYSKLDGSWEWDSVWSFPSVRVRDVESGDVNGDGLPELVACTHDNGSVVVIGLISGSWYATEVYSDEGVYVHEIEMGDVNGDGLPEFFSNPTDPNPSKGLTQAGSILMHEWNGSGYASLQVDGFNATHAKEMVVGDLDNDGLPELVASVSGIARHSSEPDDSGLIEMLLEEPVRLNTYEFNNGTFARETIAEIGDMEARGLAIGDADNDGLNELVVGTENRGLQIVQADGNSWRRDVIDGGLTGIRDVIIADVYGNGFNDVVAGSDMLGTVNVYEWSGQEWDGRAVLQGLEGYWVWAMDFGDVDNE